MESYGSVRNMTSTGADRPKDIRLSPADGIPLSNERYDVRARDGKLIRTVDRAKAELAIASGHFELWSGPSGAYLRPVNLAYPTESRHSNMVPDSRHTLHGREATTNGASLSALYRHNADGCETWRKF
jgi:hypothetical protein